MDLEYVDMKPIDLKPSLKPGLKSIEEIQLEFQAHQLTYHGAALEPISPVNICVKPPKADTKRLFTEIWPPGTEVFLNTKIQRPNNEDRLAKTEIKYSRTKNRLISEDNRLRQTDGKRPQTETALSETKYEYFEIAGLSPKPKGAAPKYEEIMPKPEKGDAPEIPAGQAKNKKHSIFAVISNLLFYMAIALVLLTAFSSGSQSGKPRMILGYSDQIVLTSSMQSEIPKGSLIIVKRVDPKELQVGDNISYMRDTETSVTHKIINIFENYENSGARGFETKGVNNANPDKDIVYEANVIGRVVFSLPGVGGAIALLGSNIQVVFVIFAAFAILSFSLRGLFVYLRKRSIKQAGKKAKL